MKPPIIINRIADHIFDPWNHETPVNHEKYREKYYKLEFANHQLFNIFLRYLENSSFSKIHSTKIQNVASIQNPPMHGSLYNYYVGHEKNVDSKNWTVRLTIKVGIDHIIGKFYLETGIQPAPFEHCYGKCHPHFFQPVLSLPRNFKMRNYLRGVPKVLLEKDTGYEVRIPQKIIMELQARFTQPVLNKLFIILVSMFTKRLKLDLRISLTLISYLSDEDKSDMVMTKPDNSKRSFLEQHISETDKNDEIVKEILRPLLKMEDTYCEDLKYGKDLLNIKIGIDKTSNKPALAYMDSNGYRVILDEKDKLVVKDLSNNYKDVDSLSAFLVIRNFGLNLLLVAKKWDQYSESLHKSIQTQRDNDSDSETDSGSESEDDSTSLPAPPRFSFWRNNNNDKGTVSSKCLVM
jgi:hypothetical protein